LQKRPSLTASLGFTPKAVNPLKAGIAANPLIPFGEKTFPGLAGNYPLPAHNGIVLETSSSVKNSLVIQGTFPDLKIKKISGSKKKWVRGRLRTAQSGSLFVPSASY
jgi:hypothetical protein